MSTGNGQHRTQMPIRIFAALAALSASLAFAADPPAPEREAQSQPNPDAGLDGIYKLVDAHVAPEVIQTYAETLTLTAPLKADDIIALTERGVGDKTIRTLLDRGRVEPPALAPEQPVRRSGAPRQRLVGFHPESYEFWLYNYANPRARALSYRSYPAWESRPGYGWNRPRWHRNRLPFGTPSF